MAREGPLGFMSLLVVAIGVWLVVTGVNAWSARSLWMVPAGVAIAAVGVLGIRFLVRHAVADELPATFTEAMPVSAVTLDWESAITDDSFDHGRPEGGNGSAL